MKSFSLVFVCVLVVCLASPLHAQSAKAQKNKPSKQKENAAEISKERKEQLLEFVDANHPELKSLLTKLEENKRQRPYRQAMAGLDKTVKKLEGIKERSPKRYDLALKQWTLESRIKVAGAEVKHNDNEKSRSKLKELVTQLVDFHINRMKNDQKQLLQRLEQIDKRIDEAEASREQTIEKRIKGATRIGKKKSKRTESQ